MSADPSASPLRALPLTLFVLLASSSGCGGNWEHTGGGDGGRAGDASNAGGRSGAGGSTGGSGAGSDEPPGAAGTPAFDDCEVVPINPNATRQARNLLCYLYSEYGNHVLSGQEESTWVDGPDYEMEYIFATTGKYPAVRGMDFQQAGVARRAIAWWARGGISQVGFHMGAPGEPDTYEGTMVAADIDATLTPGTLEHASLLQKLDYAANELQRMEDAEVPVIWRPFHEAGGNWFWWSMQGGDRYVALWNFTYDYLTLEKGLDNLIWLLPFNGDPNAAFYPGNERADLVGADTYARSGNHGPQAMLFSETRAIAGETIPIALHENGPIPDPDELQSSDTAWVLFNTWHTDHIIDPSTNPVAQLIKTYNHPYVITLDELPSLR